MNLLGARHSKRHRDLLERLRLDRVQFVIAPQAQRHQGVTHPGDDKCLEYLVGLYLQIACECLYRVSAGCVGAGFVPGRWYALCGGWLAGDQFDIGSETAGGTFNAKVARFYLVAPDVER